MSAGCVQVITLREVRVNMDIISMCSKRFHNRSTGCQPSRLTDSMVWIDYEKWTGNGLRKLWRCQPTHTKPLGSDEVGPSETCPGYVICDNRLERLAVAIVAMNP
jgi:hypothetical protein